MGASVQADDFASALRAWGERSARATEHATQESAELVREAIQDNLARSYYPPASEPGTPPAWRTGYLHGRVYVDVVAADGMWQARVYPSTVYARIQELSGWAGRGHRSFLPARPYVRPASDETAPRVGQVFAAAWREALPAG